MAPRWTICCLALGVWFPPQEAPAQGWGTLQGQVVWGGEALPKPKAQHVNKDQVACLKQGPILSEKYEIDKETKGVRWVMVWLIHPRNPRIPVGPIHPKLVEPEQEAVSFDQPCCKFIPHVLGMRKGQKLIAKNSSSISHNVFMPLQGVNVCIPSKQQYTIDDVRVRRTPQPINCTIHPWMNMYVHCFDHPYFAVTDEKGNFEIKDAPAGKWNLVVWHENGYVVADKTGTPINIVAGKTTSVGPFEMTE